MIGPTYFIRSQRFQALPGEEEHSNPGRYGKAFASWIAEALESRSELVEGIVPEDFGWCIILRSRPVRYWIACGNREGSQYEWGAYVVARQNLVRRLFKRTNVKPEVDRISRILREILAQVSDSNGVAEE